MKTGPGSKSASPPNRRGPVHSPAPLAEIIFTLFAGAWVGLSLIKFGNPVVLDSRITTPANFQQWLFFAWPVRYGYLALAVVAITSLKLLRPRLERAHWPIVLLALWLFWQFLSGSRTVEKSLTTITLIHFATCSVAFLIGWWALGRTRLGAPFWAPILIALLYVLFAGFDQRNGGLEAMRKDFFSQTNWQLYPSEYIAKIQTNRIWATLVYPNALAGVLLFFLPVCLWKLWEYSSRWPRIARGVVIGFYGYLGVACLYWTGSKGGWLIALGMGAIGLLHLRFSRKLKTALVVAGLVLGLAAFFIRFSDYFRKGATSVGARFTYWSAAVQTTRENPVFGTGPGTFWEAYRKIKPPDAEPARLTHNDYLEQASDSGLPGAIFYTGFIAISLWTIYRKCVMRDVQSFLLWLGLVGWAAQSFIEFPLYIPALSWPVFLFLGWFWSQKELLKVKE